MIKIQKEQKDQNKENVRPIEKVVEIKASEKVPVIISSENDRKTRFGKERGVSPLGGLKGESRVLRKHIQ